MPSKKPQVRPYFPSKTMRKPMVAWLKPGVLFRTLRDILRSWVVETQIDTRELQNAAHTPSKAEEWIVYDWQGRSQQGSSGRRNNKESFYFDYIADTGDGWNSTYSIAHLLSRDRLRVFTDQSQNEEIFLPRGRFLILGGDEVYPSASDEEYRNRLVRPFSYAWDWCWLSSRKAHEEATAKNTERQWGEFPDPKRQPYLYAIPGNHDWYDCLSSFRRRFCNPKHPRYLGKWKTDQSRSYFAIELPANYYILALDIGLDCNLDNQQYNYFMKFAQKMKPAGKILLLTAEPLWVSGGIQSNRLYRLIESFEDDIKEIFAKKKQKPPKILLYLSGDTHNYQRYERKNKENIQKEASKLLLLIKQPPAGLYHKYLKELLDSYCKKHSIVCGGGGAFLHPTHGTRAFQMRLVLDRSFRKGREQDPKKIELPVADSFVHKNSYPDEATSRRLAWKAARRFLSNKTNRWLALVIGLGHSLLAAPGAFLIGKIFHLFFASSPRQQIPQLILEHLWLVMAATIGALLLAWIYARLPALGTPGYSKPTHPFGWFWGVFQAVLATGLSLVSFYLPSNLFPALSHWPEASLALSLLTVVLANSIAGSLIYAHGLACLSVCFGMSHNDAFAHASIEDYKSFLRFEITPEGRLWVYPVAVPKVVAYAIPSPEEIVQENWDTQGKFRPSPEAYVEANTSPIPSEKLTCHLIEGPIELS